MIVVCVLLQSAITGKVTEIARMHVSNVGGTGQVGDYDVATLRGRDSTAFETRVVNRKGKVTGHRRRELHVWHLISKALQAVGYGKPETARLP